MFYSYKYLIIIYTFSNTQMQQSINQFNQPCNQHGLTCALFCPDPACKHFLCEQCVDPHSKSGTVLQAQQIRAILIEKHKATQADSLALICKDAHNTYQQIATLTEKFQSVVTRLDQLCGLEEAKALKNRMPAESISIIENIAYGSALDEKQQLEALKGKLANAKSLKEIKDMINLPIVVMAPTNIQEEKAKVIIPAKEMVKTKEAGDKPIDKVNVPTPTEKNAKEEENKKQESKKFEVWSEKEWDQKYKDAILKLDEKHEQTITAKEILENKSSRIDG